MVNISFLNLVVVKEKSSRYDVQKKINSPKDIYDIAVKVIKAGEQAEENLWLITLDTKNNITGIFEVSRGSLNTSIVHPREIFKRAIMQNSASIILLHNHPSGDVKPSKEDIQVTQKIVECGRILNINLLDHVIIGDDCYKSFKEEGLL